MFRKNGKKTARARKRDCILRQNRSGPLHTPDSKSTFPGAPGSVASGPATGSVASDPPLAVVRGCNSPRWAKQPDRLHPLRLRRWFEDAIRRAGRIDGRRRRICGESAEACKPPVKEPRHATLCRICAGAWSGLRRGRRLRQRIACRDSRFRGNDSGTVNTVPLSTMDGPAGFRVLQAATAAASARGLCTHRGISSQRDDLLNDLPEILTAGMISSACIPTGHQR